MLSAYVCAQRLSSNYINKKEGLRPVTFLMFNIFFRLQPCNLARAGGINVNNRVAFVINRTAS